MQEAQTLIAALNLSGSQAQAVLALAGGTTTTTTTSGYKFNTNLTIGSTGNDVKQLQMVLNSDADTKLAVAAGSAGSAGYESMTFGPATKAAVIKYQTKHNISPASGYVGSLTRASLNAMGGTTTTTTPTQTGPVSVMVAGSNPGAGNVLQGQATAGFLDVTFTGNGTVTAVTLQRTGISVSTDLTNVYLYDGATRLGDSATINNNGVVNFNGLNIAVNGSRTVSVKADVSSSATTATIGLNMTGFTANGSTSTVSLTGNQMWVVSAPSTMADVQICTGGCTATGASQNQTANLTVNAGVTGQTVWQAPIQVSQRSVALKGMTLRFVGSAPYDSLANVRLMIDGVQAGQTTTVNSNGYIVFDMMGSPVTVNTGSHTFEVRADVVKGSSYSFQLSLQNAADLMVTDTQLNVNVAPTTNSTTTFSQSQAGTITVNTGSITVTIDPSFSAMTNVTGGATNSVIAKYKLRGYGEDIKVTSLSVTPALSSATPSASGLNNVTLYFNGSQVGSSQNWTSGALTFNLGSSMIVPANQDATLEVRADLQTSANANYTSGTVTATLNLGTNNAEGLSSRQATIDVPAAAVATTGLTIQTGTLSVSTNSAVSSQTMNPNTVGAKIGSYIVQNRSTSESVRVTNLAVGLTFNTAASTNYSNLKTSETSGSGSTPINPSTTNSFSVDFTLAPGTSKTIDVFADLGTASSGSIVSTLQLTAVGQSSNVTVCSSSLTGGNNGCDSGTALTGQTITLGSGTFGTPAFVTTGSTLAQYIAGGTTTGALDATNANFKFTATNGNATITELGFEDTVGGGALTKIKVGSVEGAVASNKAYLFGLNTAVPNGGAGVTLGVKASYAPVGPNGGLTTTTTGDITSLLKLIYVKYTIGGTTSTLCANGKSPSAGNCTATTSMPISSAQTMTLVGSKPTVTVSQPTGVVLSTGNVEAIDVTISADAAGPISITSFPVTATISAGAGTPLFTTATTFVVKDKDNNTVSLASNTGSINQLTGNTTGTAVVTFATPYLIGAGESQTFKVFIPVTAVGTGTLPNTYLYSSLAATSGFVWTDTAGNATNSTGSNITSSIYNYPSTFTSSIHN